MAMLPWQVQERVLMACVEDRMLAEAAEENKVAPGPSVQLLWMVERENPAPLPVAEPAPTERTV